MVKAPGVRVPLRDAQRTRTQLAADGSLRTDLAPLRDETSIVFPIKEGADAFDFQERRRRPASYHDLLPEPLRDAAPRAFDTLGDVAILKIPAAHWEDRQAIGDALLEFLSARAVFHDHGVTGTYRVRELERIAGSGSPATTVQEHGVTLHVDVSRAYFSPRLADERGRVASLVQPGEFAVDMFGGVAPQAIQLARAGARVLSNDLNPDAHALAMENVKANRVDVELRCGDARALTDDVAGANRIVMNLPHGAADFLPTALAIAAPGATIHLHEILPDARIAERTRDLESVGRVLGSRHVRNYSAADSHLCFDIEVPA